MDNRRFFYVFFLLLVCTGNCGFVLIGEPFRAAGIQLEIHPSIYRNEESFTSYAAKIIEETLAAGKVDLIIFPEYTGVFFAFFGLDVQTVLEGKTLDAGLKLLESRYGTESLEEYFLRYPVDSSMDRIWGGLARRYGVAILGGTCFAVADGVSGRELRNRAVLYDRDGRVRYRQDKVFLTPFESDLIGIKPGSFNAADSITFNAHEIGITICRDTFFSVWEQKYADVDVWIDIKANGEQYDRRQAEIFRKALPARLRTVQDAVGVTVCLNGTFLDLLWEGPSSVIRMVRQGEKTVVNYLDTAESVREQSVVRLEIP
jgi:predicted amidohydrolase